MTVSQLFLLESSLEKRFKKASACERHMRIITKISWINPFIGRQAEVNAGDDIIMGCGNLG